MKTLVLHTCFVVALGSLIGCGDVDGTLQHEEQAVAIAEPCLCAPGSLSCSGCQPPKLIPYCGDGILSPVEECDKTALGGETCASLGYSGGTLSCKADCTYDTSGCTTCGDGLVQGTEQCDGANLAGATCASLGLHGGTLGCTSSCTFDLSQCERCGDGIVNGPEECDGTAQALPTCESQGYDGGTVSCSATCEYDWSSCLQHYAGKESFCVPIPTFGDWGQFRGWVNSCYPVGPRCGGIQEWMGFSLLWTPFECDPGDLCIDPNKKLCGRYVKHAAGQIYSALENGGLGPWCGCLSYLPCDSTSDLPVKCQLAGDVCTDYTKRECTRK